MPGKFLKGAFIQFMPTFLIPLPNVIMFQYNPETMTHTWQPAAPDYTPMADKKPNPLAVQGLPSESFSFTLVMNSDDTIADGSAVTAGLAIGTGLYSRLSALEMLLYPSGSFTGDKLLGKVSTAVASAFGASPQKTNVPQYVMPTVLFVWGPARIVPIRLKSLTITEKLYDSILLNPTYAEAVVNFDVLSPEEVSRLNDSLAGVATAAYVYSQAFRQAMALANLTNTVESVLGLLPSFG